MLCEIIFFHSLYKLDIYVCVCVFFFLPPININIKMQQIFTHMWDMRLST